MKISFSKDYGSVVVALEEENREQDMAKCRILEKLYTSDEWLTLLELLAQAEDKFDEAVMKVKPSEQSFRENAIYSARKSGFCEAMGLLKKAVESYRIYRAEQKEIINRQVDEMMGRTEDLVVND